MKRKLLAAAVASAFAMPALAQVPAEIQIYGRVNVTGERIETDNSNDPAVPNQSNYELVDNSSRIGIRGKKELTPGLSAIFQIESRVNLTDGGDVLSSRDSYAGLQGAFGTIRTGRTIGPVYYATYDYISMHNHDTGTSSDALLNTTIFGNQGFMNNTLWYTSPKIGPITIDAAFSLLGEEREDPAMDQPRHIGLVASYDQGPLHAAISYANTENDADLVAGPGTRASSATAWTIGGAYDFKFMVLGALWEMAETDIVGGSVDSDYWRIAAMFPFGQHELHVNYGLVDADGDRGAQQWTLAYNYNITKTTKVYAFYTVVDNDNAGNFVMGGSTSTIASATGAQYSSIAIGFRHNF
ncbi:MAG TPA: porin [Burkholderiales bacterium]|nr:porin [Burkholderiales bacterium]